MWRYFAPCIDTVRRCVHSGKCSGTRSCTIVERSPARCGGYIQSVKWSTSNGPRNRSAGRPLQAAPGRAPAVRERQEADPRLDVDARERLRDRPLPGRARRREGDDLVAPAGRLDEPRERAADVVADARSADATAGDTSNAILTSRRLYAEAVAEVACPRPAARSSDVLSRAARYRATQERASSRRT